MIVRSVVVLPLPLRPTMHTASPAPTSSEIPRRMSLASIATRNSATRSSGSVICPRGGPPHGPPHPPALGAPRGTRGAPRSLACSSAGAAAASPRSPGAARVAAADDRVDQPFVGAHGGRRSIGQDAALVQGHDAVGVAEDDVHVVLDLDDGLYSHASGSLHQGLHDR